VGPDCEGKRIGYTHPEVLSHLTSKEHRDLLRRFLRFQTAQEGSDEAVVLVLERTGVKEALRVPLVH